MPHSPRVHGGALWVLDSGNGYLTRIDRESGAAERVAFCPGFLRGLSFHDGHAVVGLSLARHEGVFSGLPLQEELDRRRGEAWCGIQIVNTANGDIVEWLRLEGGIRELFDVRVLPGVRCPMALPTFGPDLASFITIEAPDRHLRPLGLHHSPRRGGESSRRNVSPIRVLPKLVDLPHMLAECRLHLGRRTERRRQETRVRVLPRELLHRAQPRC